VNYGAVRLLVHRQAGRHLAACERPAAGLLRSFGRVAIPMGVLNLSSFCVSSVQVPVLGLLLGPELVPAFYLAQRIGQVLNVGVMQVIFPQLPLFTQHLAAGQWQAARHRMKRTIVWVTGMAVLANLGFYFGSPWFVLLWIGPGRYVTSAVLALMAVDYSLLGAAVVWSHFVLAGGENPFVASTVLSGILNLLLLFLLIPALGMVGIPLASLLAGVAINYWFVPLRGFRLLSGLAPRGAHLP
jgi:O-antigen/teichoic acid export membrane protein